MKVQVVSFGKIADILGAKSLEVNASDTSELQNILFERFPALRNSMFAIAVNRQVVTGHTELSENAEVALLPPFSGG
jgi:molybdopterin synthase sulfur carrier subunit